ncbi:ribosome maturation factor RimM [Trichloromonas sp.]|uniref:ribosome maturation factor RimM n=1 Tax=Trichloromonas sp. TaxID=3069249 RepID=UPI002A435CE3|nr:ribosome maturation factor RimM [Trichloromonas sp.]
MASIVPPALNPAKSSEWFVVGSVVGVHGLRGDLKVRPLTADSDALFSATRLLLVDRTGKELPVVPARVAPHKGIFLVRLRGLDGIDVVEGLVGREVRMRYDDLPELAGDEYYWHQLQGLRVVDRLRGELGRLDDLLATGAHDIYVVNGPFGEVLIPAVGPFVLAVDLDAGLMTVELPEGLVPEADDL